METHQPSSSTMEVKTEKKNIPSVNCKILFKVIQISTNSLMQLIGVIEQLQNKFLNNDRLFMDDTIQEDIAMLITTFETVKKSNNMEISNELEKKKNMMVQIGEFLKFIQAVHFPSQSITINLVFNEISAILSRIIECFEWNSNSSEVDNIIALITSAKVNDQYEMNGVLEEIKRKLVSMKDMVYDYGMKFSEYLQGSFEEIEQLMKSLYDERSSIIPQEEYTVIWADQTYQDDNEHVEKNITDHIHFLIPNSRSCLIRLGKKEELIEYLREQTKDKLKHNNYLIMSGSIGNELNKSGGLVSLPNIEKFYIYCANLDFHKAWAKSYPKCGDVVNMFSPIESDIYSSIFSKLYTGIYSVFDYLTASHCLLDINYLASEINSSTGPSLSELKIEKICKQFFASQFQEYTALTSLELKSVRNALIPLSGKPLNEISTKLGEILNSNDQVRLFLNNSLHCMRKDVFMCIEPIVREFRGMIYLWSKNNQFSNKAFNLYFPCPMNSSSFCSKFDIGGYIILPGFTRWYVDMNSALQNCPKNLTEKLVIKISYTEKLTLINFGNEFLLNNFALFKIVNKTKDVWTIESIDKIY